VFQVPKHLPRVFEITFWTRGHKASVRWVVLSIFKQIVFECSAPKASLITFVNHSVVKPYSSSAEVRGVIESTLTSSSALAYLPRLKPHEKGVAAPDPVATGTGVTQSDYQIGRRIVMESPSLEGCYLSVNNHLVRIACNSLSDSDTTVLMSHRNFQTMKMGKSTLTLPTNTRTRRTLLF
jgi:hypothetical protein